MKCKSYKRTTKCNCRGYLAEGIFYADSACSKHNHIEPNLNDYMMKEAIPNKVKHGTGGLGNGMVLMHPSLPSQETMSLRLVSHSRTNTLNGLVPEPKVTLEDQILWRKFNSLTNEMVISKSGRSVSH
jgi:hypothetical protein